MGNFFGLKHPKMTTPEWGCEVASALVLKLMCPLLPKNALLFLELPFYFPELLFYFSEVPFYFLELPFCFPGVMFCFPEVRFLKNALLFYCFPELLFSFPEVPSIYLLCTSFSKNASLQLMVPSRPAQSCSER